MNTVVEAQEGNNVKLTIEISEADFEPAIDAAFRKIGREVRIPGFRPGKTPRRILEQRVGRDYARQQAIQDGLPEFYVRAIVDNEVDVISQPELSLTGGTESGPITFEAIVETRPKIRVPGYDGLQVAIPSPEPSDDEVTAQVDRMRSAFAVSATVERQAHAGDQAVIDIEGSVDGETVPGLVAADYTYEIGSGSVVPELDANLIGAEAGQTLNFDAAVPGDDDAERIDFVVTVKAILERQLPEATDEWASSTSEFTTMEELRADISKRMSLVKKVQANIAMRDETVKALIELVDAEIPEALVNSEIGRRIDDLQQRLDQQGATIPDYLAATGQSEQQLIDDARASAIEAVKADLALRAVVEGEAIEASDEDVTTEIGRLAERFKMKPAKVRSNLEKSYQIGILKMDIRKAKALTWLTEHASIVDGEGRSIDRSILEVGPADYAMAGAQPQTLGLESNVDVDDDFSDHDDHDGHDH
jgi:trigger factor